MVMKLTKSGIAILLSKLHQFRLPKFVDEQYETDSEIASTILWNAFMAGHVDEKVVADLGAGPGILGIGGGLLGACKVYFVEKDERVIDILKQNIETTRKDLANFPFEVIFDDIRNFRTKVDTVFQNPPFGVKRRHADRIFLEKAFEIADVVYSLHKSESTEFLQKFAEQHGFQLVSEQKFSFPLKNTMKYHTSRIKRIGVSCYTFKRK